MRNLKSITAAIFAASLALNPPGVLAQYGPPPGAYAQGGWDAPPREYREYQRRGFSDGIEGARRDVENHRRADVNNRDEFRHPNVPGQFRRDYRAGFRRGYYASIQHFQNGPR